MGTTYAPQGTVPTPTKAWVKVAITSTTNASPVAVTTSSSHGFNTGDTVEIEGNSVSANNSLWIITVTGSTTFTLNSSSAPGSTGSGGIALDYQVQPAFTIPSAGDLVSAAAINPTLEGLGNGIPFLYRRAGKWRLHNEFQILGGSYTTPIITSGVWSSNATFSSSSFISLANASFLVGGSSSGTISDGTNVGPIFNAGDLVEWSVSYSALGQCNGGSSAFGYLNIGTQIGPTGVVGTGTAMNMLSMPFSTMVVNDVSPTLPAAICNTGSIIFGSSGAPFNNIALTVGLRVDTFSTATNTLLNLLGPFTGWVRQYRAN